jgi:hypothetical protein
MRRLKWAALVGAVAALAVVPPARAEQAITVAPTSAPNLGNCFPFWTGQLWTPYAAFFYRNLPAFELKPNEIVAFDTNAVNNVDIQLEIAMAPAPNGTTTENGPFTRVVSNTQTPLNPRGDTTVGNFELQFHAEQTFTFPGGGLIIRFSNPSTAYAADNDCTISGNLVGAAATDASGFFLRRAFADADGSAPWSVDGDPNDEDIAAFQLRLADPPAPPPAAPPPVSDTDPPATTITKHPPNRLDGTKAKFKFTSDEAGATFECKSDRKPFKSCTSPNVIKRLDEGKHKFEVRATDSAGNVDDTPAKDKFKVVGDQ